MALSHAEMQLQKRTALDALIEWAGSPSRLAMLFGYTPTSVWYWDRQGCISREGARRAAEITDGLFSFEQLRPDLAEKEQYKQSGS
jgi:DNA-binding transcriptional regulator YdaS (Cro superfamily)